MAILAVEPFWLLPDTVSRLTFHEIWEWYLRKKIEQAKADGKLPAIPGDDMSPVPAAAPEEDHAANALAQAQYVAQMFGGVDVKSLAESILKGNTEPCPPMQAASQKPV